jgi:hypothetical protein
VGAEKAAEADAKNFGGVVVAHGERHLEILAGVQAAGVLEMPLPQAAGAAQ